MNKLMTTEYDSLQQIISQDADLIPIENTAGLVRIDQDFMFNDCWVKLHSRPEIDENDCTNYYDHSTRATVKCSVQTPGSHPGGNAYWLTPINEIYAEMDPAELDSILSWAIVSHHEGAARKQHSINDDIVILNYVIPGNCFVDANSDMDSKKAITLGCNYDTVECFVSSNNFDCYIES